MQTHLRKGQLALNSCKTDKPSPRHTSSCRLFAALPFGDSPSLASFKARSALWQVAKHIRASRRVSPYCRNPRSRVDPPASIGAAATRATGGAGPQDRLCLGDRADMESGGVFQ